MNAKILASLADSSPSLNFQYSAKLCSTWLLGNCAASCSIRAAFPLLAASFKAMKVSSARDKPAGALAAKACGIIACVASKKVAVRVKFRKVFLKRMACVISSL